MNNYKYIPTYAGEPIAEAKSYLDSLEKQYDLAKDKKNALDVFLGGFQSNDEDGKKYIDGVKGILTDKVQNIAKDSKGNIKWHTAMEGLDSVAYQVAGDMKLKHVQERYNKYKEEEDLVRKLKLEKGNNSFYSNEVPNKAFDENGDPIQYQNRYELKLDHIGAAKKLVDQMHDQIETITSDTALPGYIQTGKKQFVNADKMEPMLEKAYDIALNNSPELQQMAKREGEDAVKKLIKDTLGLREYDYTQTSVTAIPGSSTDKKTNTGELLSLEPGFVEQNTTNKISNVEASLFEDVKGSDKERYPYTIPHLVGKTDDDVKIDNADRDFYEKMIKYNLGEEVFAKMSPQEKSNYTNDNLDQFNRLKTTVNGESKILAFNVLDESLVSGFKSYAETNLSLDTRTVYVPQSGIDSKDKKTLAEKLPKGFDSESYTAHVKGFFIGNNDNTEEFDGGITYTLRDKNNRSVDVVIPYKGMGEEVREDIKYLKDKSTVAKSDKTFTAEGSIGKETSYLTNYLPKDITSRLNPEEIILANSIEFRQYAKYDKKANNIFSGSIVNSKKLPAGVGSQELKKFLESLDIPYFIDTNNKIVIKDTFITENIVKNISNNQGLRNSFRRKEIIPAN